MFKRLKNKAKGQPRITTKPDVKESGTPNDKSFEKMIVSTRDWFAGKAGKVYASQDSAKESKESQSKNLDQRVTGFMDAFKKAAVVKYGVTTAADKEAAKKAKGEAVAQIIDIMDSYVNDDKRVSNITKSLETLLGHLRDHKKVDKDKLNTGKGLSGMKKSDTQKIFHDIKETIKQRIEIHEHLANKVEKLPKLADAYEKKIAEATKDLGKKSATRDPQDIARLKGLIKEYGDKRKVIIDLYVLAKDADNRSGVNSAKGVAELATKLNELQKAASDNQHKDHVVAELVSGSGAAGDLIRSIRTAVNLEMVHLGDAIQGVDVNALEEHQEKVEDKDTQIQITFESNKSKPVDVEDSEWDQEEKSAPGPE